MAWNTDGVELNKRLQGYIATANKNQIGVHLHGNADKFYNEILPALKKRAEDHQYFKNEKSHSVSGIVRLPKPANINFEQEILAGIFENVTYQDFGAYILVNSISLALFCIAMGAKFTYPIDTDAIRAKNNLTFFEERTNAR